jgi:hypothetical protein
MLNTMHFNGQNTQQHGNVLSEMFSGIFREQKVAYARLCNLKHKLCHLFA